MPMTPTAPDVEFIEMAADMLNDLDAEIRAKQQDQLNEFGDHRAQDLGASGLSKDFRAGYELGLQTMRARVLEMPAAIKAGVEL